jgi:hypothetical protein
LGRISGGKTRAASVVLSVWRCSGGKTPFKSRVGHTLSDESMISFDSLVLVLLIAVKTDSLNPDALALRIVPEPNTSNVGPVSDFD